MDVKSPDLGTIGRLAMPLILNGAIEASFGLTDTWFVGHVSVRATAALASVAWLDYCGVLLFSGLALAVQTSAAQAHGAGRRYAASRAAWSGMFAALLAFPAFALLGLLAKPILMSAGIDPQIRQLALRYWWPRFAIGGPITVLALSVSSFFSAIGQTSRTFLIGAAMTLSNAAFNALYVVHWGYGITGVGFATASGAAVGVVVGMGFLLSPDMRRVFRPHLTWRRPHLRRQFALGLPIGLGLAVDMFAFALMQLMVVRIGSSAGAAMQIVTASIAIPYVVGSGISQAGTTLVAQAYGRRQLASVFADGAVVVRFAVAAMATLGLIVTLAMPWLVAAFLNGTEPGSGAVRALCVQMVGPAMLFQVCDGWKLASNCCLMGVDDVRVPALLATALAWCLWVPAAYVLIFGRDGGRMFACLPHGAGPVGGWLASTLYSAVLGAILYWRWRRGAWSRPAT